MICARDAHVSTHTALMLTGARPVWVAPEQDPGWGVGTRHHAGRAGHGPRRAPGREARPRRLTVLRRGLLRPAAAGRRRPPSRRAARRRRGLGAAPALRRARPACPSTRSPPAPTPSSPRRTRCCRACPRARSCWSAAARIPVDRVAAAVRMTQTTSPYLPLVASVDSCRAQLRGRRPRPGRRGPSTWPGSRAPCSLGCPGCGCSRPRTSASTAGCRPTAGSTRARSSSTSAVAASTGSAPTGRCARRTASPSRAPTRAVSTSSSAPATRWPRCDAWCSPWPPWAAPDARRGRRPHRSRTMPEQAVTPRDAYFAEQERVAARPRPSGGSAPSSSRRTRPASPCSRRARS